MSDDFAENDPAWTEACIPMLAGIATVTSRPEHWIDKLLGAAAPAHRARLLHCAEALATSHDG